MSECYERHPRRAWFLQPLGSVGQVSLIAADLQRSETVDRAVEGADAVINLVGIFDGNLDAVHVDGAGKLAAAAKRAGAGAFVHISALATSADIPNTAVSSGGGRDTRFTMSAT